MDKGLSVGVEEITAQEAELPVDQRQLRVGHPEAKHDTQPVEQVLGDGLHRIPLMAGLGDVQRPCCRVVSSYLTVALKLIEPHEALGSIAGERHILHPDAVARLDHVHPMAGCPPPAGVVLHPTAWQLDFVYILCHYIVLLNYYRSYSLALRARARPIGLRRFLLAYRLAARGLPAPRYPLATPLLPPCYRLGPCLDCAWISVRSPLHLRQISVRCPLHLPYISVVANYALRCHELLSIIFYLLT